MRGDLSPATDYMGDDMANSHTLAAPARGGANGVGRPRAAAYGLVAQSRNGVTLRTYGLDAAAIDATDAIGGASSNGAGRPPREAAYGLMTQSGNGVALRTYGLAAGAIDAGSPNGAAGSDEGRGVPPGGGNGDVVAAPARPPAAASYGLVEPAGNAAARPVYGLQPQASEAAAPAPGAAAVALASVAAPDRDGTDAEHELVESVTTPAPRAFEGGERSPAPTERVELPATLPPRLNTGSRIVVAGLAASVATAVLSLLLRGARGA